MKNSLEFTRPTGNNILVVDDNPDVLRSTTRILESKGYGVLEADSGRACLILLETNHPDLVLLDVMLPDINGLEVCRRIKANPSLADLFVILVSAGQTSSEHQSLGLEAGADGYIARPITNRELIARIQTSLRVKKAEDELRKAREELEQRVAERTAELRQTNEMLRIEINKRKSVIASLIESENPFSTFFRSNLIAAAISRVADEKFVEVNDSFLKLFGYARHELLGHSSNELGLWSVPEDRERFIRELLDRGSVCELEVKFRRKSGVIGDVLISAGFIELQGQRYIFGLIVDVTERKRMEDEIRKLSGKLTSIIESSRDVIAMMDTEFRYVLFNAAFHDKFETIFGKDLKVGDSLPEALAHIPKDLANLMEYWNRAFAGQHFAVAHQFGDPGLVRKWYELQFSTIRDNEGKVIGGVHIGRDISERKRAEEEKEKLLELNRQLQKSESLGRMAGAIAHHFNNKLMAVMMNLEFAMKGLPRNAEHSENLTGAMQAARQAAQISTQMLTYLGQTTAKQEPTDLADLCNKSLAMLRAVMPTNAVLEAELPSPGPVIHGNSNQMQQVLSNLLTNAWDALIGKHGIVRLAIKTMAGADIPDENRFPIDFQPEATTYACLEVSDTGCGIPSQDVEKIFDPFFSTKFTGRGLGLAVVQGIAKAHNGVITVQSDPGRGSTFRVYLPVSAEALPPQPVSGNQAPIVSGSGTILLVEDEQSVRKPVAAALNSIGYTVLEAQDGVMAVDIFQKHHSVIRLVITDMSMPGMDGWQTLDALRKIAPNIPVILVSGYSEAQVMAGHHPELPQAFLKKPYELEELKYLLVSCRLTLFNEP